MGDLCYRKLLILLINQSQEAVLAFPHFSFRNNIWLFQTLGPYKSMDEHNIKVYKSALKIKKLNQLLYTHSKDRLYNTGLYATKPKWKNIVE